MSTVARRGGHEQYAAWIAAAGRWFSPFSSSRAPLVFGRWTSWTVEGLYQGLKLIAIRDLRLVDPRLDPVFIDVRGEVQAHFPSIMAVRENVSRHIVFRVTKSGAGFDGKRNRLLGMLPAGDRNWTMTGTFRNPEDGTPMPQRDFMTRVYREAFRRHLQGYPEAVAQLRDRWRRGECLVTPEMRQAHGHLLLVEEFVLGQAEARNSPGR